MVGVLRRPGVARLGAAGLLSEVGDWMLFIALPLFVLQLSGSALVTATVFALELVPTVIAGPLAGALIDRCDPWRLMRAVAALQALLLLPLLLVESAGELWIVYAVVVGESVLGTVIEPCRAATAATLVPAGELMPANQAMGLLSSVARLVGGPLGGFVLGVGGIDGVLVADAATFLAAAALFTIRAPARERPVAAPARAGLLRDWLDGFAVIARVPMLRRMVSVVALMALAQGAFVVLFLLFVVRDLGGARPTSACCAASRRSGRWRAASGSAPASAGSTRRRLVAGSLALFGLLSLIVWNAPALTTAFGLYVGLFIAVGVPGLATMTALLTLMQEHAGEAMRGRVIGTFFALYGGVQAAGMLLAGLVGTGVGLSAALQVQGACYLAAAALALRLSAWRPRVVTMRPWPSTR